MLLQTATVTLPYKDFQEILDKNKEYEELFKKIKSIETMKKEKFNNDPFVKLLDEISNLLDTASKTSKANEKQYYIYQCLSRYCEVFKISKPEFLEDVPQGSLSKEKTKKE
jgi:hypothetical protein